MDITVLGSGAAYPRPGGACSGFLVRNGDTNVWLDAGNGTFSRLQQHIEGSEVDAVVLSHVHADHIADILPFMYCLGYLREPPLEPIPVYTTDEVRKAATMFVGRTSMEIFSRVMEFRPIAESFDVDGIRFDAFRTNHPPETFGVRISYNDSVAVYTADTAAFPELAQNCAEADLLITEATYVRSVEATPDIHMWAHEAGSMAQEAKAKRVLLTHVWPTIEISEAISEAAETYTGDLSPAAEGERYTV
ncbi:MAG: MBL fold metallo-hydrolase [Actinomycetota bacterium]